MKTYLAIPIKQVITDDEFKKLDWYLYQSIWTYAIGEISTDKLRYLPKEWNAIKITKDLAYAAKFCDSYLKDRDFIKVRPKSHQFQQVKDTFKDVEIPTHEDAKLIYKITKKDEQDAVELWKVLLNDYLARHFKHLTQRDYLQYLPKRRNIMNEISKCNTLVEIHRVGYRYFGIPMHQKQRADENCYNPTYDLSQLGHSNAHYEPITTDPGPTKENVDPGEFTLIVNMVSEIHGTLQE